MDLRVRLAVFVVLPLLLLLLLPLLVVVVVEEEEDTHCSTHIWGHFLTEPTAGSTRTQITLRHTHHIHPTTKIMVLGEEASLGGWGGTHVCPNQRLLSSHPSCVPDPTITLCTAENRFLNDFQTLRIVFNSWAQWVKRSDG